MKLNAFLLAGLLLHVIALDSSAQSPRLSIHLGDTNVEEALKTLEHQTDFYFLLNQELVDVDRAINLHLDDQTIEEILNFIFEGTNVRYLIMGKQIIISPGEYLSDPGFGQKDSGTLNLKISGIVLSEQGEALPGVNIVIKGTTQGFITDKYGQFSLGLSGKGQILVFSYVGYESLEIEAGLERKLNVVLREDIFGLDGVIKIGYGSMKKRDLTGAISSIKAKDLPMVSTTSVGQSLIGKIAGLQITPISAQPGGGYRFTVRGAGSMEAGNNPLIVIDGFPVMGMDQASGWWRDTNTGLTSPFNFLNPNEIETVEVLKDASSTAIYGAQAANGVILITTRKGSPGKNLVQFSTSLGLQQAVGNFNVLNASQLMQSYNEASKEQWMASWGVIPFGQRTEKEAQELESWKPRFSEEEIASPQTDTDWFDLVSRQGIVLNNNLAVSGGAESTRYAISLGQHRTEGIVKNNGLDRYSVRINLDQDLGKKITFGINMSQHMLIYRNMRLSDDNDRDAGIIRAAYYASPLVKAIDQDGNYPLNPDATFLPNPYSMLTMSDDSRNDEFIGIAHAEWRPVNGLRIEGNFGLNKGKANRGRYSPKTTTEGQQLNGLAYVSQRDLTDLMIEWTATYTRTFADRHSLNVLLGYAYHQYKGYSQELYNTGYFSDAFTYNALAFADDPTIVYSDRQENELASYFGRLNYTFDNRYLLTTTLRRDGSSRFAENNKWGWFPSLAIAWNIHRESFFESKQGVISLLKLRASYGETGNSNVGSYAYSSYSARPVFRFGAGTAATGVYPYRWANPDLKWEMTQELNLGIDIGLKDDRLFVSLDIYYKEVSDLLRLSKPLQSYNEVPYIAANAGATESRGMELTLNTVNLRRSTWQWNSALTFSFYRDRWKERYDDWKPAIYENVNDPLRARWGYENDGIMTIGRFESEGAPPHFPDLLPGMVIIKDINGFATDDDGNRLVDQNGKFIYSGSPDGVINDADVVYKGKDDPDFIAGLTNRISYRNFSLDLYFYGLFGRQLTNPWFSGPENITRYLSNTNKLFMDRWTIDQPSSEIPGYMQAIYGKYGDGGFMEQDAWFIRCRNLTLSYRMSTRLIRPLQELRLYFDFQNLFTLGPYDGIDPETDAGVLYPNVRTYSLGLDLSF